MSEQRELELKLEVGPRQLGRLRTKALQALGEPLARQHLVAVYFDTPDHRLRQAGLSLRIRSADSQSVQTIKKSSAGVGSGLFDRPEWETPVEQPEPELGTEGGALVKKALRKGDGATLQPVFTTEVDRTTWRVDTAEAAVEVVLDAGAVIAGEARSEVAELELELKRGSAADLFALARRLDGAGSLKLGMLTKSERGYRLAGGEAGFHKADAVKLRRGMPVAEAFPAIVRACIRHFRLNETAVVEQRLPEALHQARVAMRRLRSALSLFKELLGDPQSEAMRARLKALSDQLGHARNLDVYLQAAEEPPEGAPEPDPAWIEKLKADREAAYDDIAKALSSKRFRSISFDLLAWVETGAWRHPTDPDMRARLQGPVEAFAADILDKRRRRVRRRGRDLAGIDPEARHEVRIEVKKLRYAAEFFSGLVGGKTEKKRLKAFQSALEGLQETLGDLNDLATAESLRATQSESEPGLTPEQQAEHKAALLERAVAAHEAFSEGKSFWRDFA